LSGVSAAQAGVSNLEAQLAKTIIRSPISGKIAALPLRAGELASPGTLLATVVGDQTRLQVKASVSGDDLSRLKVGQNVLIEGAVKGTVSNVSPSIDPATKKAEVDIDIADSVHSGLVVGENVTALIAAGTTSVSSSYTLPIQDVKIIPGSAFVYTVDADSKIKSNPVMLGQIRGDFVEVTSGIDDSMNIVAPVYELDPGQKVQVQ
jgi:RND family efflux transporter MFP subunit